MKFTAFNKFFTSDVLSFLKVQYNRVMADLSIGLTKLTFDDNFDCDVPSRNPSLLNITIAPTTEVTVQHILNRVPQGFLIINSSGTNSVTRGDAAWTKTTVSLKNVHATATAVVSVLIL